MVVDTSALVAILCDEPERRMFTEALEEQAKRSGDTHPSETATLGAPGAFL